MVAMGSHVLVPAASSSDTFSDPIVDKMSRPGTAELFPPKHVTAVVVSQDLRDEDKELKCETPGSDDVSIEEDIRSESPDEEQKPTDRTDEILGTSGKVKPKSDNLDNRSQQESGPIVGVFNIGVLQGQRIKTVQKLSNNRPSNKFKEQTFKKKIYSRKLPQVGEKHADQNFLL